MVINGPVLLATAPIQEMLPFKTKQHGVSHGLGEAGYDIRIKQGVEFRKLLWLIPAYRVDGGRWHLGKFALASAMEKFQMPVGLVGIVHDKSTWARRGLSVFNTVIENGWNGHLTLELVYHGKGALLIPAGAGIAQVMFHQSCCDASYKGKYQNQEDMPVPARKSL
jgi:dCTP deaminase